MSKPITFKTIKQLKDWSLKESIESALQEQIKVLGTKDPERIKLTERALRSMAYGTLGIYLCWNVDCETLGAEEELFQEKTNEVFAECATFMRADLLEP